MWKAVSASLRGVSGCLVSWGWFNQGERGDARLDGDVPFNLGFVDCAMEAVLGRILAFRVDKSGCEVDEVLDCS